MDLEKSSSGRRSQSTRHRSHLRTFSRRRNIREEDMADYMANKAMRVAKKLKKLRKTILNGHYSKNINSNPFRDSNLIEKFVWLKKIERDIAHGVPFYDAFSVKAEKKRHKERVAEIDRVVKRRKRVEEDKAIAKEAQQQQQEEKEISSLLVLAEKQKEVEFEFQQSKLRSEIIRLREVREAEEQLASENNLELKALKAMGVMEELGDAIFGAAQLVLSNDIDDNNNKYYWARKPKYVNRFHTGYVWNKYNQTHYDHHNPPPRIVKGYKFNIFYPDLIDKTKSPVYSIDKDGNNTETCIIRFHAGPPYQDIGFRVINRDWDYSPNKGFKCKFEHDGLLQLYFNFKRYSYRR